MQLPENCPTKDRIVQGDAYKAAGMEDFAFPMPRPFVEEDFTEVAKRLAISAAGLANTCNQTLAENLGNNLAQKIKAAVKFNDELAEAQENGKREDEELRELPDETDLDEMVANYDFTGVRAGGGTSTASMSPLQKAIYKFARQLIRTILRENGMGDMAAPVTVAKRDSEPADNQISYATYEALVEELAEGEGRWGDELAEVREDAVLEPARAQVKAEEQSVVQVQVNLGLSG